MRKLQSSDFHNSVTRGCMGIQRVPCWIKFNDLHINACRGIYSSFRLKTTQMPIDFLLNQETSWDYLLVEGSERYGRWKWQSKQIGRFPLTVCVCTWAWLRAHLNPFHHVCSLCWSTIRKTGTGMNNDLSNYCQEETQSILLYFSNNSFSLTLSNYLPFWTCILSLTFTVPLSD